MGSDYEHKLAIAKEAYKSIMCAMDKLDAENDDRLCFHWDECISVDDELFCSWQLRGDKG